MQRGMTTFLPDMNVASARSGIVGKERDAGGGGSGGKAGVTRVGCRIHGQNIEFNKS
jgi:hypothetical protein